MFPAQGQLGRTFPSSVAALARVRDALAATPDALPWMLSLSGEPRLSGVVRAPEAHLRYAIGRGRSRITYTIILRTQPSPEGWSVIYSFERVPIFRLAGLLLAIPILIWISVQKDLGVIPLVVFGGVLAAILFESWRAHERSHDVERALEVMYGDDLTDHERLARPPTSPA